MKQNRSKFHIKISIAVVVVSAAIFALLLDLFKENVSSVTILVNAKSDVSARQHEKILNNLVEFPRLLPFYDRMLKDNPDIRDVAEGESPDARKKIWNSMMQTEILNGKSSLVRISVVAKRQSDAEKLASKATRTLLDLSGAYYDIKNDLDLRIIEGPVSQTKFSGWCWILPLSLILGILVVFIFHNLLQPSKDLISALKKKTQELPKKEYFRFGKSDVLEKSGIKSLEDLYKMEESEKSFFAKDKGAENRKKDFIREEEDERTKEMKRITKEFSSPKYPNYPELPVSEQKKSEAPSNLPVAEDADFSIGSGQAKNDEKRFIDLDSEPKSDMNREPTEEDIKKRLNQLLKGE